MTTNSWFYPMSTHSPLANHTHACMHACMHARIHTHTCTHHTHTRNIDPLVLQCLSELPMSPSNVLRNRCRGHICFITSNEPATSKLVVRQRLNAMAACQHLSHLLATGMHPSTPAAEAKKTNLRKTSPHAAS